MRGEAGPTAERALARARPDLALVQARSTAAVLERAGWKCRLLPNAVDTARFRPADDSVRAALRERFGFRPDERVVLHLGHLKPKRNLEALVPLVAAGTRVVVVASTYQGVDPAVHRRLVRAGLDVRTGYVPDVERLYSAADVYAFPVRRGATLQMPLSVLEALACDRPVVSVPHEGLVEFLEEGDGLTFAEPEAFAKAVRGASAAGVRTRAKVLACGVDVVVPRLERHYESVLEAAA